MKRFHFWFSPEQKDVIAHFKGKPNQTLCNVNGKIMEYTIASSTNNHNCLYDDMVYLGEGTIYSINGVLQK